MYFIRQSHFIVLLLLFFSLFYENTSAQSAKHSIHSTQNKNVTHPQITFIENMGQVHNQYEQFRSDVLLMGVSDKSQLVISDWGYSHQLHTVHYS